MGGEFGDGKIVEENGKVFEEDGKEGVGREGKMDGMVGRRIYREHQGIFPVGTFCLTCMKNFCA